MARLTQNDIALCVAALEHAASDLREGVASANRLGIAIDVNILTKSANEMMELRARLMGSAV